MAQITGLLEKQKALKNIQSRIKSLEPLNVFLKAQNPTNEYVVSFAKTKATILCPSKDTIDAFVTAYKDSVVNEIQELAKTHSITLDEEDLKIMNELYVPGHSKASIANE